MSSSGQLYKQALEASLLCKKAGFSSMPALLGSDPAPGTRESVTNIRRILNENPEAAQALTSNALNVAGWGKLNMLQGVPVAGDILRSLTFYRLGLGAGYRPGHDPGAAENATSPVYRQPGFAKNEQAAYGLSQIRREILANSYLKNKMVDDLAHKGKLNVLKRWYLKRHPEKALEALGIRPMAGRVVFDDDDVMRSNNVVASEYFV